MDCCAQATNRNARGTTRFTTVKICVPATESRCIVVRCSADGMSRRGPRTERATIVVVDALGISGYEIDGGATVFLLRARLPTPDEIGEIASRFREVAEAGASHSAASWGGAGGPGFGIERGSRADSSPAGLIRATRF